MSAATGRGNLHTPPQHTRYTRISHTHTNRTHTVSAVNSFHILYKLQHTAVLFSFLQSPNACCIVIYYI